jgi:hypothetical protein
MSEVRTFWRSRTGRALHRIPNCQGHTLHPVQVDANHWSLLLPACGVCWPGPPWVKWPRGRCVWVDE